MVWKIILGIIAFIVILLHFSIVVDLNASVDGIIIKVRYLGITLYPRKPKKQRSKKRKKSKESSTDSDEIADEELFEDNIEEELEDDIDTSEESSDKEVKTENKPEDEETASDDAESDKTDDSEKTEKPEKVKKEKKTSEKKPKGKGKLAELKEKYLMIKPYIPVTWKYLKKLLKAIRFYFNDIKIKVGREDAHEAAIFYGMIQGTAANLLSTLSEWFVVKVKGFDVQCVFTENTIDASAKLKIRTRPSTLIAIVFCIAVNYVIIFLRERKHKKTKNNQNSDKTEVVESAA